MQERGEGQEVWHSYRQARPLHQRVHETHLIRSAYPGRTPSFTPILGDLGNAGLLGPGQAGLAYDLAETGDLGLHEPQQVVGWARVDRDQALTLDEFLAH